MDKKAVALTKRLRSKLTATRASFLTPTFRLCLFSASRRALGNRSQQLRSKRGHYTPLTWALSMSVVFIQAKQHQASTNQSKAPLWPFPFKKLCGQQPWLIQKPRV